MLRPRRRLRSARLRCVVAIELGKVPRGFTNDVSILYERCSRSTPTFGELGRISKKRLQSIAQIFGNARNPFSDLLSSSVLKMNCLPLTGSSFGGGFLPRVVFSR